VRQRSGMRIENCTHGEYIQLHTRRDKLVQAREMNEASKGTAPTAVYRFAETSLHVGKRAKINDVPKGKGTQALIYMYIPVRDVDT
jgi:hypothetical protein